MTMRAAALGALSGTALALASGLGGAPQAQGTPPPGEERCLAIMKIVSGIVDEYHGRISADLIADLQKKIGEDGKCNGPDEYRVWPNTKDREALGRIRSLLSAWDACQKEPSREGCK
jgi:hypothetical protein